MKFHSRSQLPSNRGEKSSFVTKIFIDVERRSPADEWKECEFIT